MNVGWNGRSFILGDPLAVGSEVVVKIIERAVFPMTWREEKSRFQYTHPIPKFLFFLRHEGPALTLRKVFASRLHQKIAEARVLAFVHGTHDGIPVVALGPLCTPHMDVACFSVSCVANIPAGRDAVWCLETTWTFLKDKPDVMLALYNYSAYSGLELEFFLKDALASGSRVPSISRPPLSAPLLTFPSKNSNAQNSGELSLFLAGGGAYACAYIMPHTKRITRHTVIDINPVVAATIGAKFGFQFWETACATGLKRLADCQEPVLIVATYHSTHYEVLECALACNPATKVFLEKPPVTSFTQLEGLLQKRQEGYDIEIGYNRRYSPMVEEAKRILSTKNGPVVMTCLVKELNIPLTHWYYWPSQGTRIIGNLCHWLDLGTLFIQATPLFVSLGSAIGSLPGDEITIVISYDDGSRLTLMSTDCGNSLRGVQEYIDIRQEDTAISINDFLWMSVLEGGSSKTRRAIIRNKGHKRMSQMYMRRILRGEPSKYSDRDLYISSMLYLSIAEAAKSGRSLVKMKLSFLDAGKCPKAGKDA